MEVIGGEFVSPLQFCTGSERVAVGERDLATRRRRMRRCHTCVARSEREMYMQKRELPGSEPSAARAPTGSRSPDYGSRVGSWAVRIVLLCNPTEKAQMIPLNWNIELSTSPKYMRKRTGPCLSRCQHEAEHCHLCLWSDKVAEL